MDALQLPDFMALWDYSKPAETEAKLRGLLPAAEAGPDRSYHAQLLTQIARTYGLRAKFSEAHDLLNAADALIASAEAGGADMQLARLRSLLERGRTLNSSGTPAAAVPLFIDAFNLGMAIGNDDLAIDGIHMVAIAGTPEQQMEWSAKGIEAARASSDERAPRWEGALLQNLGWTYHNLGRFDEALSTWQQHVDWRLANAGPVTQRIAKWLVARCLRSMGRFEESLAKQRELLAEFEVAGEQDGYVFEELGECLLCLGRADEAAPQFAKAWELLSKDESLAATAGERLKRMKELGRLG
jgi:tetratricopeptide (TPR) repeat protein